MAGPLCDVAPGGSSLLVSWALLNLTHRDGHEDLKPMPVGAPVNVSLTLNAVGHQMPAGHHWRLAVSPTYWPHLWPSPEPVTLTIHGGELRLPARAAARRRRRVAGVRAPRDRAAARS